MKLAHIMEGNLLHQKSTVLYLHSNIQTVFDQTSWYHVLAKLKQN